MSHNSFESRHIGPRNQEISDMLSTLKIASIDQLIDETVPASIRLKKALNLPAGISEYDYAQHIDELAKKNKQYKTYIGLGYYNTITPAVIRRNVLENPGWYTAYTPYQAEIAQGRLEALLNFQTMIGDFTGMPIANASLLDEGTAAAEAMIMFHSNRTREAVKMNANKLFLSERLYPQTIDVIKGRSLPLGIEIVLGDERFAALDSTYFGAILQYPDAYGQAMNYADFTKKAHTSGAFVAVCADLMSLALLTPPGEWGADVVVGNSQRFGVPMGYGGPHAAYFATKEDFKRHIPGRIIGVSIDAQGKPALRMALQTREQHIRRDKATSNICTAQALLAIMASMYAVYHGAEGIKEIATNIHNKTIALSEALQGLGYDSVNSQYFDTLLIRLNGTDAKGLKAVAESNEVNLYYVNENHVSISLDETTSISDLNTLVEVFAKAIGKASGTITADYVASRTSVLSNELKRTSSYLTHPVFNSYRSESEMMRYIKKLENRDISLTHSMISLGSCTMKLNAASELYPITNPAFANMHPFVPVDQAGGYQQMLKTLSSDLAEITGFDAVSLQPNSGAQGEYAGLMVMKAYHEDMGNGHRNVILIPSSAHGTNPASAAMAGLQIVVTGCDEQGNIDVADLKAKAEKHSENLFGLMVTYPSTHGVFEEAIIEITDIIHSLGGQVYMDGANMNAQVGLTNPATIGADVCHLNLHKTFAIPHGGGGPGMGPICVRKHLAPYLPTNPVINFNPEKGINSISAAPWGSALILLISYGYIKMLGSEGVTNSTKFAILNANYMKELLKDSFDVLYVGGNGRVAHEMILDCRKFKRTAEVEVADIAKRLIDYGFHAPTVSFPVAGTLMIEPTESESKVELDRFCAALIEIRKEIAEIEEGKYSKTNNVLTNAPHKATLVAADEWPFEYTRKKAAYPLPYLVENKVWSSVGRVDNAYGDRNLVCSCPPIELYMTEEA